MLLEGSRGMAPTLEAVYPSAGGKPDKMAAADDGESNRKYGSVAAEVPVVSFSGAPWYKLPSNGSGLTARTHGFRTLETLEAPPSRAGPLRSVPERPEPVFPPVSYKSRMPTQHIRQDAVDFSAPAQHRKSMFISSQRPHMAGLPVQTVTSSSSASSQVPSEGSGEAAAAAAAAASVFFQRAFHPAGLPAYPPGAPLPGTSHPGLHHPHPAHPAAYAGVPPPGAAGFMSLAHILFQPKYPLGKKTFTCHECRYVTDRKNNLKRHVATMHQDCGKFLECCDTIFRSKAALRDHVLLYHRTGYKCRFCGRNFCRKALLKRHLTVHNGQKEFICEVCDYATSHKSNLERHRKVHGLGSPIGSDDEEHFFRDGPDAEIYRRRMHDDDDLVSEDGGMAHDVSVGGGGGSGGGGGIPGRGHEMYIDVESVHTDCVSETSADDVISVMSDANMTSPMIHESMNPHMLSPLYPPSLALDKDPVIARPDPLLDAFPIGSGSAKTAGRKSKSRLYLADRLRQTYYSQDPIESGTDSMNKPTGTYNQVSSTKISPQIDDDQNMTKTVRVYETEGAESAPGKPLWRPGGVGERDGSTSPRSPPPKTSRAGLCPDGVLNTVVNGTDKNDTQKPVRNGESKGRRRLYASPYKCSECGKGLSSQQKLIEHSVFCRNYGVEPTSLMKPLHVTSPDEITSHLRHTQDVIAVDKSIGSPADSLNQRKTLFPSVGAGRTEHGSEIPDARNLKRRREMPDGDLTEAVDMTTGDQRVTTDARDSLGFSVSASDYSVRRLVGRDVADAGRMEPGRSAEHVGPARPCAERPEPGGLAPARPKPEHPESGRSGSGRPEPTHPEPGRPGAVRSGAARPVPARPGSTYPEPGRRISTPTSLAYIEEEPGKLLPIKKRSVTHVINFTSDNAC